MRIAAAAGTRKRVEIHRADRRFRRVLQGFALALLALLGSMGAFLAFNAVPAIRKFGFGFLTSAVWDPVRDIYGAFPVIYGTLASSFLAILLATPLSVGVALFLTEVSRGRLSAIVGFLVEMLAAIPSVVYGLWGVFVLVPWLRESVEPTLKSVLGFLPLFQGPAYGVGMLAGGMILAIMITPTISSICREVFRAIPSIQREAATGLGATRWEMIRLSVLKSSRRGITGAVILGLGRALGETMAVTMVIGNRHEVSASLFSPASTMASVIANEYSEATSELQLSSLVFVGLVLFILTFFVNAMARVLVRSHE